MKDEQWNGGDTPQVAPDARFREDLYRALQETHRQQRVQRQLYGDAGGAARPAPLGQLRIARAQRRVWAAFRGTNGTRGRQKFGRQRSVGGLFILRRHPVSLLLIQLGQEQRGNHRAVRRVWVCVRVLRLCPALDFVLEAVARRAGLEHPASVRTEPRETAGDLRDGGPVGGRGAVEAAAPEFRVEGEEVGEPRR